MGGETGLNGDSSPSSKSVPVNEVGGPVDGVDDPGGRVCEDTGGPGGDRLLADEATGPQGSNKGVVTAAITGARLRTCISRAPVSGELLFNGGYNELFHSPVRLGDQVDRRALLHDVDVFVERLTDHLAGTRLFNGRLHPGL